MLRIAICDDDSAVRTIIFNCLMEIEDDHTLAFDIQVFESGESLHKYIFENAFIFDIIFLDIELGKMNGIDIGKMLRNNFRSLLTQIVFVSNHEKYAMDLFKLHPFDFLIKPLRYRHIEKTVLDIINIMFKQNGTFKYKVAHKEYEIELYKVLYFKTEAGRKIRIHTFKDNLSYDLFYGRMSHISEPLLKQDFFLANSYYLVNYYAVTEFRYNKIKLVNGQELNISQTFRKAVRDLHMEKAGVKDEDDGRVLF